MCNIQNLTILWTELGYTKVCTSKRDPTPLAIITVVCLVMSLKMTAHYHSALVLDSSAVTVHCHILLRQSCQQRCAPLDPVLSWQAAWQAHIQHKVCAVSSGAQHTMPLGRLVERARVMRSRSK